MIVIYGLASIVLLGSLWLVADGIIDWRNRQ